MSKIELLESVCFGPILAPRGRGFLSKRGAQPITTFQQFGWARVPDEKGSSLVFLAGLRLRAVEVYASGTVDCKALEAQKQIELLGFRLRFKSALDLASFPQLRILKGNCQPALRGLATPCGGRKLTKTSCD
ncbi:hypothetical protein ABI59_08000 [Acidobacteria bacterium Mor1]|nr:hypothetical protein ABI59_08000 [Acidobacteria bacterium Mor1]